MGHLLQRQMFLQSIGIEEFVAAELAGDPALLKYVAPVGNGLNETDVLLYEEDGQVERTLQVQNMLFDLGDH